MPVQKRITSDSVYIPTGGINKTNSLSLRKDEALEIINMRPTPAGLVTREGTTRFSEGVPHIAYDIPSEDTVLHFHTYKSDADANIPFAFTRNNIFKYSAGTDSWTPCLYSASAVFDACDNVANWTSDHAASPFNVPSVDVGAHVASIAITNAGSGYTTAPTITIAAPTLADSDTVLLEANVQATATCTISGGVIDSVTITNKGLGYIATPAITLSAVSGGASLTATTANYWSRIRLDRDTHPSPDAASVERISAGTYLKKTYSPAIDLSSYSGFSVFIRSSQDGGFWGGSALDPEDEFLVTVKNSAGATLAVTHSWNTTLTGGPVTLLPANTGGVVDGNHLHDLRIKFTSDDATTRASVASIQVTIKPAGGLFIEPDQWYLDNFTGYSDLSTDVSFWSTTDFVEGGAYKVIAAGSDPSLPYERDADGLRRVLLCLDTSDMIFKELVLKEVRTVLDESTNVTINQGVIDPTVSSLTRPAAMSSGEVVVPGSASLHTIQSGTIATSSAIDESGHPANSYAVTTVNDKVTAKDNGSFMAEAGSWSLKLVDTTLDGELIYMDYSFQETVAIKPRYVWSFGGRLLMGNTYEGTDHYDYRLRWTNAGSSEILQTLNYHDLTDDDSSRIMGGEAQSSYFNIYKQNTIYRITHVADELNIGLIFAITPVWKFGGTLAGRTVQTFNSIQYFLGLDDVYAFDGVNLRSITTHTQSRTHRIRDDIFSKRNEAAINKCFGSINQKNSEYWLWIVRSGETFPQIAYVYSIVLGTWTTFEFKNQIASTGLFHLAQGTIIDDLIGTINEQAWVINSASTSGINNTVLFGESSGEITILNENIASDGGYYAYDGADWTPGTLIKNTLITRDFIFRSLPHHDRLSRVEMHGKFTGAEMGIASTPVLDKASFNSLETLTAEEEYIYYFPDAVGSSVRIYIELTGKVLVEWIIPYAAILDVTNS